ncbi:MAG: TolC family protein [Candidatus Melainabacteria bacterium]|nr:TolC family protein [Candidatus Melainabacteria bacterium]
MALFVLHNLSILPVCSQEGEKLFGPMKLEARIDVPLELSLEKALNIAILQNLDIAKAKSQKEIDRWKYWENIGNWLPDYKLGLSAQRYDGSFLVGGVFPVMTLTSSVNAFMRFDYRFFEGGKGFFNTLAARKVYKASKENLLASQNNILLEVTRAYNNLLKEQAQLDVLTKAVEEAKSEVELNTNLEAQGVGTRFDVLQSKSQLAEQEQAYIIQQAKLREASIKLATLLNLEQGTHIKPNENDLKVKDLFDINKPITEIINLAVKNRPEVRAAKLEYGAGKNLIGVATSEFLPKANIFSQYGGTGNVLFHRTKRKGFVPDAIALDDTGSPVATMITRKRELFQAFEPVQDLSNITNVSNVIRGGGGPSSFVTDDSLRANKNYGVQVDWDIAMGLGVTTVSKINESRNKAKLLVTDFDILNQEVEKQVRTSYLNVQATKQLLEVSEARVSATTEALKIAKARITNGIGINTELLNAEKQYVDSLAYKVNSIIEHNNAQAELLYSLGLISVERLLGK